MTLNGAIKQLHELRSAEDMPIYYKPAIAEVINVLLMDAVERKRGKWIDGHCSECGCDVPAYIIDWKWQKDMVAKFCPMCGADMRTKETDLNHERAVEQLESDSL